MNVATNIYQFKYVFDLFKHICNVRNGFLLMCLNLVDCITPLKHGITARIVPECFQSGNENVCGVVRHDELGLLEDYAACDI
ncbi:hypothetical protein ATE47_01565 [Chryseobacterium sp. IHB B 17019]|nr:hypothetical protein ATE47_01565 [Chryseobacterium sp. IHB B 17019]